jgi:CBS domain-containing protein
LYGIDEYKRIRHLPVLENNAVLGVISIGDVVKSIIEIKRNNSVFDSYISGKNHNKE